MVETRKSFFAFPDLVKYADFLERILQTFVYSWQNVGDRLDALGCNHSQTISKNRLPGAHIL